ncbi:Phage protein [Marinobacterium lacunae]|uniref:Phage protein n=1 Tax=Marinobacterium lacunae TaxID=1232683 RepID=A0A081FX73_9GAMM|nr:DUF1441 family protein [Marinobacterium lacunae]KEA63128.1 Phage protein [Marinobacterium lacunae]
MANNVNGIQDAYCWSINKIAIQFEMDRRTVTERIRAAGISPAGMKNGHPVYALRDVGPALYRRQMETMTVEFNEDGEPLLEPRDRLHWYQAQIYKVQFEKTAKALVDAGDYRREMAKMAAVMLPFLESVPDHLKDATDREGCGLDDATLACAERAVSPIIEHLREVIDDNNI